MSAHLDNSLRDLKANHLKKRGDEALQKGNNKTAYLRYTEAIELKPDKELAKRLFSNRSLAYSKARRYAEGLEDAERAIALAAGWEKGHYRKGSALLGLQQYPEAALAFRNALKLNPGNVDTKKMLKSAVHSQTREQIAQGLLSVLCSLHAKGDLSRATAEEVRSEELEEGAFAIIKLAHLSLPREKPYHDQYMRWLVEGPSLVEAYTQRAAMYHAAKCFLQARQDAGRAIERCKKTPDCGDKHIQLACAYLRLGQAFLAEPKHADQNAIEAVKAFARGLDKDPDNPELKDGSKEARQLLTLEHLQQVQRELAAEGCTGLGNDTAARLEIQLRVEFGLAAAKHLSGDARKQLRESIATMFHPKLEAVELESVKQCQPGLDLTFQGFTATTRSQLRERCAALNGYKEFGESIEALLGPGRVVSASVIDDDSTDASLQLSHEADADSPEMHQTNKETQIMQIPRPKLEIALPYKSYRLVTAEGRLLERQDKHPFCMSRVFYNKSERPSEVWAEDAKKTYRWRQTGSEVKIIAMKVPSSLTASQLAVTLEPFFVKVASKSTGEVFLSGRLERGIVPKESTWMLDRGKGEDGCLLLLQKMNLELLQRHWLHSEMWWPKLFKGGPEIAWDDYEKDYSDLPLPILEAHAAVEAEREATRQLEAAERKEQQQQKDEEEAKRRRRFEELKAKKPKSFQEWADLQHELAACS